MKKFSVTGILLIVIFLLAGCIEVSLPSSYSSSQSESNPQVNPIIISLPSGGPSQPSQAQPVQDSQYTGNAAKHGNEVPTLTAQQEGNGPVHRQGSDGSYVPQSSPAYLDLCIDGWNTRGLWKYDNCLSELKKAGRDGELTKTPGGSVPYADDQKAKEGKTP